MAQIRWALGELPPKVTFLTPHGGRTKAHTDSTSPSQQPLEGARAFSGGPQVRITHCLQSSKKGTTPANRKRRQGGR